MSYKKFKLKPLCCENPICFWAMKIMIIDPRKAFQSIFFKNLQNNLVCGVNEPIMAIIKIATIFKQPINPKFRLFISFAHREETTHLCKIWTWG